MNQIIKSIMAIFMVFLMMMAFTGSAIATKENPTEKKSVIIMFKDKPDRDLIKHHGGDIKTVYHIKPAIAASIPQKAIDALNRSPKIDYIVNDIEIEIFTVEETLPWGVDRIDADIVHGYNKGTGVNVAILDSGIDYEHPDLVTNYRGGFDFGGAYIGAPNDNDPMDHDGHGTHVAGTLAAIDNEIGVIGVAPEAYLYALKIFADDGNGSYSDVVEALEWCIDTRSDADAENDIQIISMSIGSPYKSGDPKIEPWINAAYDAGILLVGAAGNDGNWRGIGDNVIYPARYDNVIAVAATKSNDNRASFSSTGSDVELAAPGYYIYSTDLNNDYTYKSGTSMACPHVTGTAALVIASGINDENANGRINDEVRQRLQETAEYLGNPLHYGFGLVDAEEAVPQNGPANQPPVADANGPYDGTEDEPVTFDGSGSYDPDEDALTYHWDFGDGSTGTGESPTHTYAAGGIYTVTLIVNDGKADSIPNTTTAVITEVNDPPVADAGLDQTASVGDAVTFDGSGSSDDGTTHSYAWDFGDDSTGTGESPTHTYTAVGTYTVTLTVTDEGGLTGTDTLIVTVTDEPTNTMHIASIEMSLKTAGPNKNGIALVTVVDDLGAPVAGATVKGHWSGLTYDEDSDLTDAFGEVKLNSDKVRNAPPGSTFTFTVDSVTLYGWIYDKSASVTTGSIPV